MRLRLILISLILLLSGGAACWMWYCNQPSPQNRAMTHVAQADEASRRAIDKRLKPIAALFARARKGTKPFAEEALSWSGKFALVKSMLPFTENDTHKDFVSAAFSRHVLRPPELQQAMEGAIKDYLSDLEAVENRLLVTLRADLEDLDHNGRDKPSYLRSNEAFRAEYQAMADKVVGTMKTDVGVTVGRELGSLVASDVAANVVIQATRTMAGEMGLGAGILGTGAASAIETLGVGMVIAIVLDYVLDAVFRMAGYDPVAKISAEVDHSLDKMEAALIKDSGKEKSGALRAQMLRIHEERATLRQKTVALILEGGK